MKIEKKDILKAQTTFVWARFHRRHPISNPPRIFVVVVLVVVVVVVVLAVTGRRDVVLGVGCWSTGGLC